MYFLLPLVVAIWGIVIYKVVGAITHEPEPLKNTPVRSISENRIFKKDTFSLIPVNRDPFLGHYYKKPTPKPKPVAPAMEDVQWPSITYLGQVSDTGKPSAIHILEINGKQLLIESGSEAEGIKILSASKGKVTLIYKGARKDFLKSN